MSRRQYRIACIPGDGIGPEVIDAALQILQAASQASSEFELEIERLPWGSAYYKDTGSYLPLNHLSTLTRFHAILFGAVGAPGRLQSPVCIG
jgi:tartrate dehydrogenase/decarboxylase / D-malate dehydrogenase